VLLFLAAIISAFWYLRNEEIERETESVKRDTEITQQQIGLRLIQNQEQLIRMARELVTRDVDRASPSRPWRPTSRERPEVTPPQLAGRAAQPQGQRTTRCSTCPNRSPARIARPVAAAGRPDNEPEQAFRTARESRQPTYTRTSTSASGQPVFQLYVPLIERNTFAGALVVEYSVETLLRQHVPPDVARRTRDGGVDERQQVLASTVTECAGPGRQPRAHHQRGAADARRLNGLVLRGQGYRTSIGLISNTLFWMVVALSVLTVWMLLGTWRHMRRRAQIQARWCRRPTSAARWRTPCPPACARWTSRAASPTSMRPSAR
jgi:hypothetical protein